MRDLKIVELEPINKQDETPSYFQYQASRPLPGDREMKEYRAKLARAYLAAQIEDQLRRRIAKCSEVNDEDFKLER